MERPHCQLGARFAYGLGCYYSYCFSEFNILAPCKVSSITCCARAKYRLACKNRAYFYPVYSGIYYFLGQFFIYRTILACNFLF